MKLADLSALQRTRYFVKSRMMPLKLRSLRRIEFNTDARPEEEHQAVSKPLYTFDSPQCLFDWRACSDQAIGGDSTAELEYNPAEKCMSLRGHIFTQNKKRLESIPYIGLEFMPWFNYNIHLPFFNLLRLRIRTDGSLVRWVCMLQARTHEDIEGSAVIIDQSKEWQTLDLPFTNFERNKDDLSPQPMAKIVSNPVFTQIGFKISSQTDRQVRMDLASIEVCYNPAVELFQAQYRRPIFYRRPDSYLNVRRIDNGKEILVRS